MESHTLRDNDGAWGVAADPQKRRVFAGQVIEQADVDFVLLMGLSATGKSTFLESCAEHEGVSVWDRDVVMNQWFPHDQRIEKCHNYLSQLEQQVLPTLVEQGRTVCVENWARTAQQRQHFLSYLPPSTQTLCCVFDGPTDLIIKRCQREKPYLPQDAELDAIVQEQHDTMEWPSHSEGWDRILYLNTFGQAGEDYLYQHLK